MNINRKTTISEGGKLANTNRRAATIVASTRKTALVAGALYLLTFIAIPTLALYHSVLTDPGYIVSSGSDTGVLWGGLIELIVALACVGTGVALFPVVKRQNEAIALGYVTTRIFEAAMIFFGVISLLSVVTLRQDFAGTAGADAASFVTVGKSLVAIHDRTFLIGQTLMPGMNAVLLGYLLYRSRLVPRVIPMLGLIGGPLMISSVIGQVLGINEQISVWSLIALLPIFAWELSLGLWLVLKGFKSSAIASETRTTSNLVAEPLVP